MATTVRKKASTAHAATAAHTRRAATSARATTRDGKNGKLYTGVQIGRGHHWHYDEGDWKETKLNANEYDTKMTGLKFKIAHKRADKGKWSAAGPTQRKHAVG